MALEASHRLTRLVLPPLVEAMKQKNLIALAVVTAIVILGAVVASKRSGASAAPAAEAGGPLHEGLTRRLNDVAVLEVTNGGQTLTIEKKGADWAIQNVNGYPAKFETVKKALIAIAELEVAEAKTSDPKRYSEIGVEDPLGEGATSTLVVLKDEGGASLASLVIGDSKPGRSPELYVRKADEARAWKVKGSVDLQSDPKTWMDREVANVASDRTKAVTVTHADGERLHVFKENRSDTNFLVEGVPADRELLSPSIANSLASVLSYLSFDEVRPVGEVDFETAPISTTEIRTWDGLVFVATVAEHDGVEWVRFRAHYEAPATPDAEADEEAVDGDAEPIESTEEDAGAEHDTAAIQAEALELDADLSPWAFLFPSYKQSNLEKRLVDLLRPPTPPPVPDDGLVDPSGATEPGDVHEDSDPESDGDPHDHDDSHDHSENGIESDD